MPSRQKNSYSTDQFIFIVRHVLERVMRLCGADVTSPQYQRNWRTVVYITAIIIGMATGWYTILSYDRELATRNLCIVSIPIQVCIMPQPDCRQTGRPSKETQPRPKLFRLTRRNFFPQRRDDEKSELDSCRIIRTAVVTKMYGIILYVKLRQTCVEKSGL